MPTTELIEDDASGENADDGVSIAEYDLTSTPNDFNVKTIVDFIEAGVFEIPAFQRHYVWDLRRASKLIESIVMGLPVPQVFLYEAGRNRFLVIDGQQRLMTVFYFVKRRFPRVEQRGALRRIIDEHGELPAKVLADDKYFVDFNLDLPPPVPNQVSRLNGLNHETLGEDQTTFNLRTIRCVVVKQNLPRDDDSSVYEIFHRLNTGGVNLTAQEIRTSLYHSDFYSLLYRLNARTGWRTILGEAEPDLRMRDVEVLLRGFAMLLEGQTYKPPMKQFLNTFSKRMQKADKKMLEQLESAFDNFLASCSSLSQGAFGLKTSALSLPVYEAVFSAVAGASLAGTESPKLSDNILTDLKTRKDFHAAVSAKTADKTQVANRLKSARQTLTPAAKNG